MPIILTPSGLASVCSLEEIEREVMSRTGPFEQLVANDGAHTASTVYVEGLITTMSLGHYENLWLLRRGYDTAGLAISGFDATDRRRRIAVWNNAQGSLQVDAPWANAPAEDEVMEACHLDPTTIRKAVQNGLKRTRFEDHVQYTLASAAPERNLTSLLPWLTKKSQVKDVRFLSTGSTWASTPVGWWKVQERSSGIWLRTGYDPYPASVWLVVNRPGHTIVNGLDSLVGPLTDTDTVNVPLERAAAAGHIECWRLVPFLLSPLAERKMGATQEQAADLHTAMNGRKTTRPRARIQLSEPLASGRF